MPARLWTLRRPIFGLGTAARPISAALIGLAAYALGLPMQTAIVVGLVLALSSTAFAVQTLAERNELRTQHGPAAFSILLFQDLAVIPLLAILPWLADAPTVGEDGFPLEATPNTDYLSIAFSIAVVALIIVLGRRLLRPLLRVVASTEVQELFTAAALLVVLAMALAMEKIGLSMALGAFLAGVLLADTEYRHRLEADIEPFKGLLLGLFFIAVGMSIDLENFANAPLTIIGAALGLVLIKAATLFALARSIRMRWEPALALAAVLPQGGEFAFVLFGAAINVGAVDRATADFLILVVAISMAMTPFTVQLADAIRERFSKKSVATMPMEVMDDGDTQVVIAGFGRFGQMIGRVLNMRRIKFVALDSDHNRIAIARRFGNEAYFGDASRLQILEAAGAGRAKLLVIAVDDPERADAIARVARMHFPTLKVFARATDRFHVYRLMELGVDHTVREYFGSSLDMAGRVFRELGVPSRRADEIIKHFKDYDEHLVREQYHIHRDEAEMIRTSKEAAAHLAGLFEHDQEVAEQEEEIDIRPKGDGATRQVAAE
jgi:glutathione-regulated potassium-efflux system ancillary protein KefC/glutathione-regulated potassium-efflux system protein KefB